VNLAAGIFRQFTLFPGVVRFLLCIRHISRLELDFNRLKGEIFFRRIKGVSVMYMYCSRPSIWAISLLTVLSLGSHRSSAQNTDSADSTPPAIPAQEQPEVLSRGPVHEAFAEPVVMQTQTGLIAPQQPPPNIEEIPPAERPQGQQFVWIPGYWSWDADRTGYIWVSACWRAAPPKMSWVPGYWAQVSGGWEWVAGFWTPAGVKNIEYLPAPPTVEDAEPVTVQPSPDTIWVPPCMYWSNGHYVRRAGYWLAAQPNWVWVPSHYVMTPRGYIFAEGHWDYSLDRRGVLFAPVYFPAAVYRRAGFTFSPGIVVDLGLLRVSLFAYPRYSHYYFGDYYDGAYLRIGIFPWFESRRHRTWYDPIYEHDRWRHHAEPRWEEHHRDEYRRRYDDRNLRPAHTFREQEARLSRLPEPQRHDSRMVQSLDVAVSSRKTTIKFERIDTDTRQKISTQATAVRTYRDERNHWESSKTTFRTAQPAGEHKPTKALSAERREMSPQPSETHKSSVTPQVENRQTVQPIKNSGSMVTTPGSQRERISSPSRETRVSRPERVQVPDSPIVGDSGKSGFFRRGPPSQPVGESRDRMETDNRRK
jgi:hypothetical protein